MKGVLIISMILLSHTGLAVTLDLDMCSMLFDNFYKPSKNNTEIYINLFKSLVKNKNAFSVSELEAILSQPHPINPLEVTNPMLPSEQSYAFRIAFENLLKSSGKNLNWKKIKYEIKQLAADEKIIKENREEAKIDTASIFAPIVVDDYKYKNFEGSVKFTFDLSDTALVTIFQDGDMAMFYDIMAKKVVPIGKAHLLAERFKTKQLSSGATLVSIGKGNSRSADKRLITGGTDIYEITPQHDFKVLKKGFQLVKSKNDEFAQIDLTLVEKTPGNIGILESFTSYDQETMKWKPSGFLEIEMESGVQKFIPFQKTPQNEVGIAKNGHIISCELDPSGLLKVQDLTDEKTLNTLVLPELAKKTFNGATIIFLDSTKGMKDSNHVILSNFAGQSSIGSFFWWIDLVSGEFFDLTIQMKDIYSTIGVAKSGDEFRVVKQSARNPGTSIAVYDQQTAQLTQYDLPIDGLTWPAQVFKLPNNESVLFIGSSILQNPSEAKELVWSNLKTGTVSHVNLRASHVTNLEHLHMVADGRIEALFRTRLGFKIIQVYGPSSKEGKK